MNEIMPFVATWMGLKTVRLSEANQTEIDKHHILSLMYGIFGNATNVYKK